MTAATVLDLSARPRGRRMRGPVLTIGVLAATTLALRLRDPHQVHSWGVCPLYAATGIYCPGCGGLRAVNDLTHGQLGAALSSNLLVTLLIPVATLALARWAVDRWQGRVRQVDHRRAQQGTAALVVVLVAFAVVRNLAFGAWLAP